MADEIAATHQGGPGGATTNVMATATELELPGQMRQTASSLLVEQDQSKARGEPGSNVVVVDSTQPIVAAIREELQKFHRPRSPNHAAISVINDPELLQNDGDCTDQLNL